METKTGLLSQNLKRFVLELAAIGAVLVGFGAYTGLKHSAYLPYSNRQFHAHRWRSDVCRAAKIDPTQCTVNVPAGNNEMAYFDICLEHGELKRIK